MKYSKRGIEKLMAKSIPIIKIVTVSKIHVL
ncbi:hypothetical protein T4B_15514 [Trichinella pseudospiralis]|uniref:Uncharacterized protein n=1 Tax=Trichinella pseudospiralis TaxID=6337 RepID=A0A0V1GCL4_TRIPS|nr:hypothetical protein T4B_15514 [Trichinella pseudospiralis]KRY96230.1 hypothetical protein T4C_104 [Trichinella pseudospiralis]